MGVCVYIYNTILILPLTEGTVEDVSCDFWKGKGALFKSIPDSVAKIIVTVSLTTLQTTHTIMRE